MQEVVSVWDMSDGAVSVVYVVMRVNGGENRVRGVKCVMTRALHSAGGTSYRPLNRLLLVAVVRPIHFPLHSPSPIRFVLSRRRPSGCESIGRHVARAGRSSLARRLRGRTTRRGGERCAREHLTINSVRRRRRRSPRVKVAPLDFRWSRYSLLHFLAEGNILLRVFLVHIHVPVFAIPRSGSRQLDERIAMDIKTRIVAALTIRGRGKVAGNKDRRVGE